MVMRQAQLVILVLMAYASSGCGDGNTREPEFPSMIESTGEDPCANEDGALSQSSFVIATRPAPGDRVSSGFSGEGCSRTTEGNVSWRLLARAGVVINSGFTTGGAGPGPESPFSFQVDCSVNQRQIGHLEVYEIDLSDGEGFPPSRTVIPLVLAP